MCLFQMELDDVNTRQAFSSELLCQHLLGLAGVGVILFSLDQILAYCEPKQSSKSIKQLILIHLKQCSRSITHNIVSIICYGTCTRTIGQLLLLLERHGASNSGVIETMRWWGSGRSRDGSTACLYHFYHCWSCRQYSSIQTWLLYRVSHFNKCLLLIPTTSYGLTLSRLLSGNTTTDCYWTENKTRQTQSASRS